jgi:hypothetical protein
MPSPVLDNPVDVLAKHVKLKLSVNQWLLRARAACAGPFAAAITP